MQSGIQRFLKIFLPISFYCYFFNYPYTLGLRFGRVSAGLEVHLTRLSVFLPQRGDTTLVYLAVYSAETIGIRWLMAMWRGQPPPGFMAADILTQHAPHIKILCSANFFCRKWDSILGLSACKSDTLTTWLTRPLANQAHFSVIWKHLRNIFCQQTHRHTFRQQDKYSGGSYRPIIKYYLFLNSLYI